MSWAKRFFKKNTRNNFLKELSRLGLAINRLYENKNYDILSNGELVVLRKFKTFKQDAIIFDVGANIGNYTLLASSEIPEAQIYSFEPIKESFKGLARAVTSNSRIQPFDMGLSNESGSKTFFSYGHSEHTSSIAIQGMNREVVNRYEAKVISGDDFMADHGIESIDLLKIDVEGAEMEVLQGFSEAFTQNRIKSCQFEYGFANISSHTLLIDFHQFFEDHGFKVGKIYPGHVDFRTYHVKQEDFLGPNYLAVLESELDLISILSKN